MFHDEDTASVFAELLAANRDNLQDNINIIDRSLKLSIVQAAFNGRISYQLADGLIQYLAYRGILCKI
jgi:6,7-dimethyl-8-ribityllumazine synthase